MKRFKNVRLVQVGLSMVVGGLVGLLVLGGAIAYFPFSAEPPLIISSLTYLVFASLYGGLLLLVLLAVWSVAREWGRGSQSDSD